MAAVSLCFRTIFYFNILEALQKCSNYHTCSIVKRHLCPGRLEISIGGLYLRELELVSGDAQSGVLYLLHSIVQHLMDQLYTDRHILAQVTVSHSDMSEIRGEYSSVNEYLYWDELPGNISLDTPFNVKLYMMKHRRVEGEDGEVFTLFYGGCFSNFWPCKKLSIHGYTYKCTEQFYMFKKAVAFADYTTAEKILDAQYPFEMKRLGRRVQNFQESKWWRDSVEVMIEANVNKNPELKKALFDVAGTTMVEASPYDRKWGIGLGMNHTDVADRSKWEGRNLLGRVLGAVRDCLMEHEDIEDTEELIDLVKEEFPNIFE